MANEITVLKSVQEAYGGQTRRVLYWYAVSPAITDFTGATVVPQKRADLPEDAVGYLSEADKAAIDSGAAGFEVVSRQQTAGETGNAFRVRLLTDHNARMAWWIQQRRDEYGQSGFGATG